MRANRQTDERVGTFLEAIRNAGFRVTHQRLEVAREIAAAQDHPDVERVYRAVQARVPTISLDTVYRTLALLADLGLVTRMVAQPGPIRYDPYIDRHHHFVCRSCGRIEDVSIPTLDRIQVPAAVRQRVLVESVQVQLQGVCAECARKEGKDE